MDLLAQIIDRNSFSYSVMLSFEELWLYKDVGCMLEHSFPSFQSWKGKDKEEEETKHSLLNSVAQFEKTYIFETVEIDNRYRLPPFFIKTNIAYQRHISMTKKKK